MGESPISVRAALESARFLMPTGNGVLPAGVAGVSPADARAKSPSELLRWAFSFPAMLGTFLVAAVFVVGRGFNVDPDVWWHTKAGQIILATHHWPTTDPFSFTAGGQPWIDCEWLGDILFAPVARWAGLQGLDALLIILGSGIMLALYAYATLRAKDSKAGFVASAVLLVLTSASFSLRPQMLGYLFLILTLIILERFRQGKVRSLWFLPPLFLVWVNAHGSWIIGLGVVFVYWTSGLLEFRLGGLEARRWTPQDRRSLSMAFLLSLCTIPITPYGPQIAAYPFEVAFKMPIGVGNVSEWQSMPFNLPGGKLFLGLILAFLVFQVICRFTWRLEELALFLFGTMMACLHLRFLLLFVPFSTPILATILARWVPPYSRSKDRYLLNAALMLAVVVGIVRFFPSQAELEKGISGNFPVRAVEYMHEHSVHGPIFNTYNFGTYLLWSDYKVFIDGRSDIYERSGAFSDYLFIDRLKPGALSVLQSYGVRACLLQRDEPLATMLAALPGWQKVYADNLSVLFVKHNGAASSDGQWGQTAPGRKE
jgi:hypothetical protein